MVTPCASASSRASVTSRPALLVPSPETSMVRRLASERRAGELRHREIDAAADRGAIGEGARRFDDLGGEILCRRLVVDDGPVDDDLLRADARPFDEGHRDLAERAGADRLDDARIDDGRGIAVALQLEFRGVDAARYVGRQHQKKIDLLGGPRRCRAKHGPLQRTAQRGPKPGGSGSSCSPPHLRPERRAHPSQA